MNENINKLRWRCRRGTLELDLMLLRYLENRYLVAEPMEQQAFLLLLELEDNELMRYLMGEQLPQDENLTDLVLAIRALPV
ncbi:MULTISPECIES: succinate dehydrogenase assembly factor 2 [Methylomonas]|uniref:FAD assembly factor SdhE n=2 Tax=Methylomonas TaxID=416 RepID=A0A126T869_9GAMM|nr:MULTISPECIES: succinate dehydrogenase assembly factor 2 [Methylomonas]AMK78277.1 hypothetical protein JT25_017595 [Methylomonas denitrificans]OAI03994.1 hypothetical protein A1342_05530 [Methylomonas methanica]TCV87692.1 antitoxin CptB [Methylomonas methanica]